MGRIGISKQNVQNAIDELKQKGINPTLSNIRQHIGIGSMTTIKRYRDDILPIEKIERKPTQNEKLMDIIECLLSALKKIELRMDDLCKRIS